MMDEESWICVDEGFSSDEYFSDSDKVDSETEAELYSLIHFEGNLSSLNCQSSGAKNGTESNGDFLLSDKMKYVLSTEKIHKGETEFVDNFDNVLQNNIDEFTGRENCDKTVSDNSVLETLDENEVAFPPNHEVPTNFVNNFSSNQTQSSKDTKKRKCDDSLQDYSSPPKKAATDSRRKINLVHVGSSGTKDIQTNICQDEDEDDEEIIFISSDSETDHSTPLKKRISPHQNISMPNIKIGEKSKDTWFVNQEDICRTRNIKARRYHDKFDVTCSNCNRKGHHNRLCPLPKSIKCYICGGEHVGTACMNRICGKCFRTGHTSRSCYIPHVFYCALCQMHGHTKQNCPDLWRRYHLTTQPGNIVPDKKVKQNSFLFCCKCGRPGHFGAVCNLDHKGYKNCFPTWPTVLSYDEPYSLPVQTPNTTQNKQRKEKKASIIQQKKKVRTEAEKLARKERRKKRKQERKERKRQEFLNSNENHKVLKEKDFPRTPKKNPANNLSCPRTLKNNSKTNLFTPEAVTNRFTPKAKKNSASVNQSSFKSQKNNTGIDLSSTRIVDDDSVIILPTPKVKKNISFIDLASSKEQVNNHTFDDPNDLPESVRLMMLSQSKRRERNRRRRIKRRQNLKEKEQSRNMST